jgi:hypothetical protein
MLIGQNYINIKAGSSVVKLEVLNYQKDSLLFINLHSNEKTSIEAIKKILPSEFGKYIGILSGGKRELSISVAGKYIRVDPNRIFTKNGIEKTLKNYGCFSEASFKTVEKFSKELLNTLSKAKLIVALHNNSNMEYSISSIMESNLTKSDALEIYHNPAKDVDDFYYVTEKVKFSYFKSKGYNVVLQDNIHVEDDGSLSVYCGRQNISYINIECQENHLKEQIEMIALIYKALKEKSFQVQR